MNFENGYIITVKTNAEFLNATFETAYKQWYKSTYNLNKDIVVWYINIDSMERQGYRNYIKDGCIIEESNSKPTRSSRPIRMVFQILKYKNMKKFVYLGKYKMDILKSTKSKRVFVPCD